MQLGTSLKPVATATWNDTSDAALLSLQAGTRRWSSWESRRIDGMRLGSHKYYVMAANADVPNRTLLLVWSQQMHHPGASITSVYEP